MDISTEFTTPNFDRKHDGTPLIIRPQGILTHTGGGTQTSDFYELLGKSGRMVSAHYYVNRAGKVYQLAPDDHRTWHAGPQDMTSKRWWGNNGASYGIIDGNTLLGVEIEHKRGQDYPQAQMDALRELYTVKIKEYNFAYTRLGTHRWWNPLRRDDPTDWNDKPFAEWVKSLYVRPGRLVEIVSPRGAYVRVGPSTMYPIAAGLDNGTRFWAAADMIKGEAPQGTTNNLWYHYLGPTQDIRAELGFCWSGIVQEVTP
jgi:hypothetical protein